MHHDPPRTPQFYITAPQKCPYIKGKYERKLFTALYGRNTEQLNDDLSLQGFRRSQKVLYRPLCSDCSACLSIRVVVNEFEPSKSQRRVVSKNKLIVRIEKKAEATDEQFEIFKSYLNSRHLNGGMSNMDALEFSSMIGETNVQSRVFEYRTTRGEGVDRLLAVCLTDTNRDGLSMVYSFYNPTYQHLSLGKFMILDHISLAQQLKLDYLYLGYWIRRNNKMGYKADYGPAEVYHKDKWTRLTKDNLDTLNIATGPNLPLIKKISPEIESIIQLPRFSTDPN
jgi:arginyl-tRNA--protein-N-Asp/Glu arginylyltransferase